MCKNKDKLERLIWNCKLLEHEVKTCPPQNSYIEMYILAVINARVGDSF